MIPYQRRGGDASEVPPCLTPASSLKPPASSADTVQLYPAL
jgi:hypothetical protein